MCLVFVTCCLHMQESMSEQNTYTQQQQQLDLYNSNRVQTSTSNGSSAGAGLRNATGEYNCFLNVIIQCLWRCQAFRKQIMQWDLDVYQVSTLCTCICHNLDAVAH